MSPEIRTSEAVFQTLNAVDTVQTVSIARQPQKFSEVGLFSVAGNHPSIAGAVAAGTASGAIHFALTTELAREHVPAPIQWIWQGVTIGGSTFSIIHNHHMGIYVSRAWTH